MLFVQPCNTALAVKLAPEATSAVELHGVQICNGSVAPRALQCDHARADDIIRVFDGALVLSGCDLRGGVYAQTGAQVVGLPEGVMEGLPEGVPELRDIDPAAEVARAVGTEAEDPDISQDEGLVD